MRTGGTKLAAILQKLLEAAKPGVDLITLDLLAQKLIKEAGGTPSFMTVEDYKWATCLCVNDVVVHGIPTKTPLKQGDVLTIDVGIVYEGLHTDTAWTKVIGGPDFHVDRRVQKFLTVGENVLWNAIAQARPGHRIGHISREIQTGIENEGFSVVKVLVGHGVGSQLHMEPQVPGILRDSIAKTPELVAGMTLAIEVIYTMGGGTVEYMPDNWSIATRDGSLSSVYEHTVYIKDGRPEVLTDMRSL